MPDNHPLNDSCIERFNELSSTVSAISGTQDRQQVVIDGVRDDVGRIIGNGKRGKMDDIETSISEMKISHAGRFSTIEGDIDHLNNAVKEVKEDIKEVKEDVNKIWKYLTVELRDQIKEAGSQPMNRIYQIIFSVMILLLGALVGVVLH